MYKSRHYWVGKLIDLEFYKKFKFNHTNKWYMYNPESVKENENDNIICDFGIQTDHLISDRRPDLVIANKKKRENLVNCGLCRSGRPQGKTERKQKETCVPRTSKRTEKKQTMEHESDCDTNRNWRFRYC